MIIDLAAERAAHLARQWPRLREARALSILEELHHRDPHQPGGAPPVTEETILAAAARRCAGEPEERGQEVAARALELHASGAFRPRRQPKQAARSARSKRGWGTRAPAGGDGAVDRRALPTAPAAPASQERDQVSTSGAPRADAAAAQADGGSAAPEVQVAARAAAGRRPRRPAEGGSVSLPRSRPPRAKVAPKTNTRGPTMSRAEAAETGAFAIPDAHGFERRHPDNALVCAHCVGPEGAAWHLPRPHEPIDSPEAPGVGPDSGSDVPVGDSVLRNAEPAIHSFPPHFELQQYTDGSWHVEATGALEWIVDMVLGAHEATLPPPADPGRR